MVAEASGPINFTTMLQLYGERLSGTDEESMLLNAFKLFDEKATGILTKDKYVLNFISWYLIHLNHNRKHSLRELLTQQGRPEERLTDSEVNF